MDSFPRTLGKFMIFVDSFFVLSLAILRTVYWKCTTFILTGERGIIYIYPLHCSSAETERKTSFLVTAAIIFQNNFFNSFVTVNNNPFLPRIKIRIGNINNAKRRDRDKISRNRKNYPASVFIGGEKKKRKQTNFASKQVYRLDI